MKQSSECTQKRVREATTQCSQAELQAQLHERQQRAAEAQRQQALLHDIETKLSAQDLPTAVEAMHKASQQGCSVDGRTVARAIEIGAGLGTVALVQVLSGLFTKKTRAIQPKVADGSEQQDKALQSKDADQPNNSTSTAHSRDAAANVGTDEPAQCNFTIDVDSYAQLLQSLVANFKPTAVRICLNLVLPQGSLLFLVHISCGSVCASAWTSVCIRWCDHPGCAS